MESQNGLYFTMAYGILDIETNELTLRRGRSPAARPCPARGGPQFLPGDGFAIGMVEDVEYDEHTIHLQPGDRVYYYSDGVPEAMNAQPRPVHRRPDAVRARQGRREAPVGER